MQKTLLLLLILSFVTSTTVADDAAIQKGFEEVSPVLKEYCLGCHSTAEKEGELDLQRFTSLASVRKDVKPWQAMILQLETGEMPPKGEPQPTPAQRKQLIGWTRKFLDSEARARAGDPGRVPLRRLSNTEFNNTVRDLTGVDLKPARDFPADGAAGEGFTNAAEALSMSPALMSKYMNAARDIAAHAKLLPTGFEFSPSKTRRDWTDESLSELRNFYWQFTRDGALPLKPYVSALVRNRDGLLAGTVKLNVIADREKLSPKYLGILWNALNDSDASWPLDRVRTRWQMATPNEVDAIVADVAAWRDALWTFGRIGSYVNSVRAVPKDPTVTDKHSIAIKVEPQLGQSEVVLYLTAQDLSGSKGGGYVVWGKPRFEGKDVPTLALRDYQQFGPRFEIDYSKLFAGTERYLSAAVEQANASGSSVKEIAAKHRVDEEWLKRWISVLGVKPLSEKPQPAEERGRAVARVEWTLLDTQTPKNPQRPAINGWIPKGTDLPVVVSNSSDKTEHVPGRVSPHTIAVHPLPDEFVAVTWKSPFAGRVRIAGRVEHAHPSCGNGVAWWVEHQATARSAIIAEGAVDLGKGADIPSQSLTVAEGDVIALAIDAKDRSHVCDLTEIKFSVTEVAVENGRVWDLAADVASNILDGNPHADGLGNTAVWSFVKGQSKARPLDRGAAVGAESLLTRWRKTASDAKGQTEAADLAKQLLALLTGARPADEKHPDRVVYDSLTSPEGALLKGIDLLRLGKASEPKRFGLDTDAFGKHPLGGTVDEDSLVLPVDQVTIVRLPAGLFRDRQFVVDGRLDSRDGSASRAVQFQVLTSPPDSTNSWDTKSPVVAESDGPGHKQFLNGLAEFRRLFPPNICYPHVIPLDEVVCLKTFHREDEPLIELFLDDVQTQELERLWNEHRFVTRYPVIENEYLPLFIGFVTQDQAQSLVKFFEDKRPEFQKWADDFQRDFDAAAPQQLEQLLDFAARAWRSPLADSEKQSLERLYQTLRNKDVSHDEAFRSVLARVLMSSSFLLHLEQSPPGITAAPVNDWELASRLSYFLWSTMPDDELRQLAAAGRLREPIVLKQQTQRMLKDDRVRALAIEFGTQWIHVRGFDEFKEKNEALFPSFDTTLRAAMYEESILFFQDLLQRDQPVTRILDADDTFLNETLAKHYGIPNVTGDEWRRVDGVRKFGRGGILGFGSVHAKQSGASRTSPILRGNWLVETLLGEQLPKPPPNVPQLPEGEAGDGGLTTRQIVEKHVSAPECATCHQRIDPFGFAFERFDAIGRLRDRDSAGRALDTTAKLRDGATFEGIDGLRAYLLNNKRDQIVRLFCQRLLGYALARSVTLSDQSALDEMTQRLEANDGRLSHAVLTIVQSKQFQMIRGSDYAEH